MAVMNASRLTSRDDPVEVDDDAAESKPTGPTANGRTLEGHERGEGRGDGETQRLTRGLSSDVLVPGGPAGPLDRTVDMCGLSTFGGIEAVPSASVEHRGRTGYPCAVTDPTVDATPIGDAPGPGRAARRVFIVMPAYNAARTLERTYRDIPHDLVDR